MSDGELRDWEGRSVDQWREQWGLPALQIHQAVGSTNDVARDLADAGAEAGTTVIAEAQSRGRGRRGRAWIADPGSSLLLSMVLRPDDPGAETLMSLRLGLAAARAIEAVAPVRVQLKWPNDLFVDRFKVAGILCEGAIMERRSLFLVAGIGINIRQRHDDWPDDLRPIASSLERSAGQTVSRPLLVGQLVAEWLAAGRLRAARLDHGEIQEYRARDLLLGRPIVVDHEPAGIGQGIDPDGALRAGEPDNPRRVIAGTVRIRDLEPGDRS